MAEGCRAFDIPVTGGNVSLYNQSPAGAIDPTPTVGLVGMIRDPKHITPSHFQSRGGCHFSCRRSERRSGGIGASLYLREIHGLKRGQPPILNIGREKKLHEAVRGAIRAGKICSAHDLAEGGLLVALAECAIGGAKQIGATVDLNLFSYPRLDGLLFGETQSRALVSTRAEDAAEVAALFLSHQVRSWQIGTVGGRDLKVNVFKDQGSGPAPP